MTDSVTISALHPSSEAAVASHFPHNHQHNRSPNQPLTPHTNIADYDSIATHSHPPRPLFLIAGMSDSNADASATPAGTTSGRRSGRAKASVNYNEQAMEDVNANVAVIEASKEKEKKKPKKEKKESTVSDVSGATSAPSTAFNIANFFSPKPTQKPISAPSLAESNAVQVSQSIASSSAAPDDQVVVVEDESTESKSKSMASINPIEDLTEEIKASPSKKRKASTKKGTANSPAKTTPTPSTPPTKKQAIAASTDVSTTPVPAPSATPSAGSGDDISEPIVLVSPPAASPPSSALTAMPVDLTNDTNSPELAPKKADSSTAAAASSASKALHPFFMKPAKKDKPSAAPIPEEPLSATSTSPLINPTSPPINSTPQSSATPPFTPIAPVKCELDALYSALPKPEFFMTRKEKTVVRSVKREKEFAQEIERDKAERLKIIQSYEASGKKIHPFLQPKALIVRAPTAAHTGSGKAGAKEYSQFAQVQFTTDANSMPHFPTEFSHVPLDFDNHVAAAEGTLPVPIKISFGSLDGFLRVEDGSFIKKDSRDDAIDHSLLEYIDLLNNFVRFHAVSHQSLPRSLPLWIRPFGYATVSYLSAPAYRSSDVSVYLGQSKVQNFLKDLVEKLKVIFSRSGQTSPWVLEAVTKQVRKMLIRRLHCFRAMQRDEQLKARRSAERAKDDASAATTATSAAATSRSDRAAQRHNKSEVAEVEAHGDEQINHGFQPRPDSLWTEQYRAFRSEEMFAGNMQQRAQVRDWLQSWSLRQTEFAPSSAPSTTATATTAPPKRKKTKFVYHSDDSDFDDAYLPPSSVAAQSSPSPTSSSPIELANTLLLVGPPVGKTSLIYACCHESDTGVIEISNSERRSQRDVLAKCEEATQSHRLAMKTMAAGSGPSIAHNVSPIKIKRIESPVKKKPITVAPTAEKPKESAKTKLPFNFFDSNSKKKAALSAVASKPPAFGDAKSKEDESDDFLNDKPTVSASNSPAPKKPRMKDLFRLKTKSIQQAVKGMPEELPESDEEEKTASGGKKRKAAAASSKDSAPSVAAGDFFVNQSSFKKAKLASTSSASLSGAAPTVDPLAPVSAISSQSTIVFEEIDNVFAAHDKKFLHAVRTLISNAKRPIILTCNSITEEMENILLNPASSISGVSGNEGMAVIERIEFNQISPAELLPYIYFICMAEVGFHNTDLQQYALPSLEEMHALLQYFQGDIRKTLLNLQIRLNSLPLTQMIGAENILAQSTASNSSTSWASAVMKTMLNFPASKTNNQDLILSILGLLGNKEEIVRMFDMEYSDFALLPTSPLRSKKQLLALKGNDSSRSSPMKNSPVANGIDSHTCSDWMVRSQVSTMVQAHQCDLQLLHLNYLQSYVHSLVIAPQQLAAQRKAVAMEDVDAIVLDSDSTSSSWFEQLPVQLSILPVTAEQMFPLESIRLTPENLARVPVLLAAVTPGPAPAVAPSDTAIPAEPSSVVEPSPVVAQPASSSESAPSPSPAGAVTEPSADEAMNEDENEEEESDDATSKPVGRRRKRISYNEDNENANDDVDMVEEDENKEEEEEGGAKRETKAQRRVREAQEYAQAKQLRRLALQWQDQQKFLIREQLIAEEQARRQQLQQQQSHASKFTAGSPHQRALEVLLHAAEAADNLSAADVFSQPNDHTGLHSYRLLNRSHARYHPAIHPFTSSASRDYFPTYLENYISSSNWHSLEQQQQDAIETELEAVERNDAKPADISRQLTLSASKESDRKKQSTFGTGDEYEVEDMILPALDMTREMHATVDVQSMRCMQSTVASLAKKEAPQQLAASWAPVTPKLPAVAIREVIPLTTTASEASPVPISSADNPIVIDSQDSALSSPPAPLASTLAVLATPQQLYLPSADSVSGAAFGVQIVAPPPSMTPQERAKWSQLAWQIWEESQCWHMFTSTAFLCDMLPHLRSLIFTALDVSKANAVSDQTANDAEIAASLAEDGGRSSRRSTRAARASGGGAKLNRKSVAMTSFI